MDNKENTPDISAFLASAIHDMKNSISVLMRFLDDNITKLEPEAQHEAAPMLYEVQRVNDNLLQMLAIYKVGNQFYPFDLTENSIGEFVREVAEQNKSLLSYLNIKLDIDCDEDLYWYFDHELVVGVIAHALNNASHYTKDKLRLVAKEEGGELVIRVEDNGRGYPGQVLDAGDAVNKGVDFASGSTGLGLYFSSMVAKLHQNRDKIGSMQLENGGTYGGGCFILRLP
ncbi:MAG: histidine kinase [Gallionellales bacterium GWA2_60_142]|jgi:K+-sensing histidine kinase KdpD|nr:MAG: histidine kinase [Gallionellales bacterium GWA2_60_142]HCI13917.1 sensor histidine kinase [Gallionellaceae bacterium]